MTAAVGSELVPLGLRLPPWSGIPFALTLGALSILPVVAPRFWHAHFPKIVLAIAAAFVAPFLAVYGGEGAHELAHILLADYLPFLVIVAGLYTVCGGVVLRGRLPGDPRTNTVLLAMGSLLASVIGTTGASMVLIQPILRANAHRARRQHIVVFFIFLVSNIGGCLTPLGDPPLFLGFLMGVPFFWTLRLAPYFLTLAVLLLAVFYLVDRRMFRRETAMPAVGGMPGPLRIEGKRDLGLLGVIVGAVALSGFWHPGTISVLHVDLPIEGLVRDAIIVACAAVSYRFSPRERRVDNAFGWEPVREVAFVFAGIFTTILPVLAMLRAGTEGPFARVFHVVTEPWHYFWATGIMSSFLDNAPTYLAMASTQVERFHPDLHGRAAGAALAASEPRFLAAVAAASVFMGANTYVGNAPNFMVKMIAERSGVAMPSFFGYVARYTLPVLVPMFILLTLVFFR